MIKFFRKIRQSLLNENRFIKYVLYAIGEIILVMVGILLALQVNNWNEGIKRVKVQIDILKGIQNDLTKDTIDINANIRALKNMVRTDSLLINHLIEQKEQSESMSDWIINTANSGISLTLHSTYYNEAKVKGLAIIENQKLREDIGRLYEFDYNYLLHLENSEPLFQFHILLRSLLIKFISLNHDGAYIANSDYSQLISDEKLHYEIWNSLNRRNKVLRNLYLPILEKVNKTLELLAKEIELLEK